jgi:hypothetical protein
MSSGLYSGENLPRMTFHPFRAAQAAAKMSFTSVASTLSSSRRMAGVFGGQVGTVTQPRCAFQNARIGLASVALTGAT